MSDLSPIPAHRWFSRWFLVACGGLLTAAVLTTGLTAHAKQAQKKDEPAKEAPKKDEPKARRAVPDNLSRIWTTIFKNFPPGFGEQQQDEFRKQLERDPAGSSSRRLRGPGPAPAARPMAAPVPGTPGDPGRGKVLH